MTWCDTTTFIASCTSDTVVIRKNVKVVAAHNSTENYYVTLQTVTHY